MAINPRTNIILEMTNNDVIPSSDTVVKKRPGGVPHPETMLFAQAMKTAKSPKVPIKDKKQQIMTLFMF
jgi:hypothetical protein